HATAGREGLIEVAVKMVETGDVCYDGTVHNSLGDLIQLMYREDGMHDVFIVHQRIDAFGLSDREGELYPTTSRHIISPSPAFSAPPHPCMSVSNICQPKSCPHHLRQGTPRWSTYGPLSAKIVSASSSSGYFSMEHVRTPPIVEDGDWLVHIFHIDCRKPSDLTSTVHQLHGEVSREAQANASLTFHMHVRATLTTHHILEEFHLNREAFEWVLDEIEAKFNHTL
ncbi:RNA polymerase II largest subunit, partial [Pisolithus tinctorius]